MRRRRERSLQAKGAHGKPLTTANHGGDRGQHRAAAEHDPARAPFVHDSTHPGIAPSPSLVVAADNRRLQGCVGRTSITLSILHELRTTAELRVTWCHPTTDTTLSTLPLTLAPPPRENDDDDEHDELSNI